MNHAPHTFVQYPDKYFCIISDFRCSPDNHTITLHDNIYIHLLSWSTRDKLAKSYPAYDLCFIYVTPLARNITMATAWTPLLLAITDNSLRAIAHVPTYPPTVGHNRHNTYPHHCGPYKQSILSDRYIINHGKMDQTWHFWPIKWPFE